MSEQAISTANKAAATSTPASMVGGVVTVHMVPASVVSRLTKTIVLLTVGSGVALLAALLALYMAVSSKTIAVAVDAKGSVIPVVPLTNPLVSESRVVGFVEECLRKAFSHDFLHHVQTLPLAQECFTPDSADKYALNMQSYITLMEQKRMVMSVTVPKPPRVVKVFVRKSQSGDVYFWDVQAQVDIFFEGKSERIPATRNDVELTVRRVPLEGTPRGILIDKFSVYPTRR